MHGIKKFGGLRFRLMAAFGIFTFLVVGACLAALSWSIPFTEQHLVAENQYYTLRGIIEMDIEKGQRPRLIPIKKLYASQAEVNGVALPLIPEAYKSVPEGYSEYEDPDSERSSFLYRMDYEGVSYILETDQTEFEEIEHRLGQVILFFAGVALLLSVVLGWVLGQTVAKPARQLALEVRRCAESPTYRPLAVGIEDDEVGYLARVCDDSFRKLHEMLDKERLFASDLSHELRTDLAVISTTAELMEETSELDPRQRSQVERVLVSAKNMQRLIGALLSLNRGDAKMAENSERPLDEVAREVASELKPEAEKKGLELRVSEEGQDFPAVPEGLGIVVLSNLVRNSIRYTDAGAIEIRVDAAGASVRDTGRGIPADELEKIFAPFFRGRGAAGKGMGIGLSLVSRVCEREGWSISVKSDEGRGTEFRLGVSDSKKA